MSVVTGYKFDAHEDSTPTLLARVCFRDATGAASPEAIEGNLAVAADLSEIEVKTHYLTDPTVAIITDTITGTISTYVTTLNTTGIWLTIVGGGNFLYDVPVANLPTAGDYKIEVKFTTTGGSVGYAIWYPNVLETIGS